MFISHTSNDDTLGHTSNDNTVGHAGSKCIELTHLPQLLAHVTALICLYCRILCFLLIYLVSLDINLLARLFWSLRERQMYKHMSNVCVKELLRNLPLLSWMHGAMTVRIVQMVKNIPTFFL